MVIIFFLKNEKGIYKPKYTEALQKRKQDLIDSIFLKLRKKL